MDGGIMCRAQAPWWLLCEKFNDKNFQGGSFPLSGFPHKPFIAWYTTDVTIAVSQDHVDAQRKFLVPGGKTFKKALVQSGYVNRALNFDTQTTQHQLHIALVSAGTYGPDVDHNGRPLFRVRHRS
jgi:hypothetical protein